MSVASKMTKPKCVFWLKCTFKSWRQNWGFFVLFLIWRFLPLPGIKFQSCLFAVVSSIKDFSTDFSQTWFKARPEVEKQTISLCFRSRTVLSFIMSNCTWAKNIWQTFPMILSHFVYFGVSPDQQESSEKLATLWDCTLAQWCFDPNANIDMLTCFQWQC